MRRDHFLDKRCQRQAVEVDLALRRQAGQPLQDAAAALALRTQQRDILAESRIVAQRPLHLLGDDRYGRQRRPEFVRGRSRQSVEADRCCSRCSTSSVAESALASSARLLGDAPGVDGRESDGRKHRHPHAGHIDERHRQPLPFGPWQGQVAEDEHARHRHDEEAQNGRHLERQRGGGDDDRHGEQQRERIGEAASEIEQAGKLQRIEQQRRTAPNRAAAGAWTESGR